jgi:hypothetical protein
MANKALYFPYIEVPDTSWTTQAVLYWDKLASIVPMDYLHAPEQMDEVTRNLMSEGLVEPVVPGMFLYAAERFSECFIEFVEQRVLPAGYYALDNAGWRPTVRVHVEKIWEISDFLVDAGLARQVEWGWYELDSTLAYHFMAYLATVLAAVPEVNATPVTDKTCFAASLGARHPTYNRSKHEFKAREVILNALLPVPAGELDIHRLVRFKQQHGALLPRLREKIEAHCSAIALMADPDARINATTLFIHECEDQIKEIEGAMRPAFGTVVFSSLIPLFGAGLALQSTEQGNLVAYTGAALSLAGSAYQAIASIRTPRMAHEAKPLAYIARARRLLA